jgi:hypothetical protein
METRRTTAANLRAVAHPIAKVVGACERSECTHFQKNERIGPIPEGPPFSGFILYLVCFHVTWQSHLAKYRPLASFHAKHPKPSQTVQPIGTLVQPHETFHPSRRTSPGSRRPVSPHRLPSPDAALRRRKQPRRRRQPLRHPAQPASRSRHQRLPRPPALPLLLRRLGRIRHRQRSRRRQLHPILRPQLRNRLRPNHPRRLRQLLLRGRQPQRQWRRRRSRRITGATE